MSAARGIDDTARLILMERREQTWRVVRFSELLREVHPEATASNIGHLWAKYMGVDGRIRPTHDLWTGKPL